MNTNYKTIILAIGLFFALSVSISAAPHDRDPTFGFNGIFIMADIGGFYDLVIQPDGKIVAAGGARIVRFNANGMLDSSFGTGGIVVIQPGNGIEFYANSATLQADGKLVLAGRSYNASTGPGFAVVRCNPNGTLDTTFNGTGIIISPVGEQSNAASTVAIQTDGKIVVAGDFSTSGLESAIFRYNSNGTPDTSFNGTGSIITPNSRANSVAIQTDGKIITAGTSYDGSSPARFTIFRYNADGSPDTSFGGTGRVFLSNLDIDVGNPDESQGNAYQVEIQFDGKIVVRGLVIFSYDGGDYFRFDPLITRFHSNGSRDTTFGINGILYFPLWNEMAVQSDGKIVSVGDVWNFTSNDSDFAVARYTPYGSADTTFNGEGIVSSNFGTQDSANGVAIQPDGKIVVVGTRFSGSNLNFVIARYQGGSNATARTPFDFDGDGRADVSVFRPSDRTWYLNRSTQGFSATQFGLSTDIPTPADYDGDGRTDIAVYRDGTWYWLNSSNNIFNARQFGIASDIPVPANYITGGGRSELAVYRDGTWWILNLADNQVSTIQFGLASDKPVVGDYDGDGRADQAVYRNGEWHLNRSTQGYGVINWGLATDKPVPADYDGDGKTDPAVYRNGTWYLLQSIQGWGEFQWGIASDIPAPADYDGDGRADAAVFRDGVWYLAQTTSGVSIQRFGLANDKPVPSAYLP